jgi:hypothetical protein
MAVEAVPEVQVDASEPNDHGYRTYRLGEFEFSRDHGPLGFDRLQGLVCGLVLNHWRCLAISRNPCGCVGPLHKGLYRPPYTKSRGSRGRFAYRCPRAERTG